MYAADFILRGTGDHNGGGYQIRSNSLGFKVGDQAGGR